MVISNCNFPIAHFTATDGEDGQGPSCNWEVFSFTTPIDPKVSVAAD